MKLPSRRTMHAQFRAFIRNFVGLPMLISGSILFLELLLVFAAVLHLYGRYHRLCRFTRTVVTPWVRRRIFRTLTTPTIITYDLLSGIVPYLSRRDLASCCRVSSLFHEVAGKRLYRSSEGVVVGDEMSYRWVPAAPAGNDRERRILGGKYGVRIKPSLFTEAANWDIDPDAINGIQMLIKERFNISLPLFPVPPVPKIQSLSKTQHALLRTVPHLIYIPPQIPQYFDYLDSTDLFPSVRTVTIQPNVVYDIPQWDLPFLGNLPAEHIRLVNVPYLGYFDWEHDHIPRVTFGQRGSVEKITIHIMDHTIAGNYNQYLQVDWPTIVTQIDFVFVAPSLSTEEHSRSDSPLHSFLPGRPPHITDIQGAASSVAHVLASAASTGARIRIIGLLDGAAETFMASGVQSTRRAMRKVMADEYGRALQHVLEEREAEERAMGLVHVSLARYRQEADYLPF